MSKQGVSRPTWPWVLPKPVTFLVFSYLGDFTTRSAVKSTCSAFNACMKESPSYPPTYSLKFIFHPTVELAKELDNKSIEHVIMYPASQDEEAWPRYTRLVQNLKMKTLEVLGITCGVKHQPPLLHSISHPTSLQKLYIEGDLECQGESQAPLFAPLARFTALTSLRVNALNSSGVRALAECKLPLQELQIASLDYPTDCSRLRHFSHLTTLIIDLVPDFRLLLHISQQLVHLKSLTDLRVYGATDFTDPDDSKVCEMFQWIRDSTVSKLKLETGQDDGDEIITDARLALLGKSNITELTLGLQPTSEFTAESVKHLTQLRSLQLNVSTISVQRNDEQEESENTKAWFECDGVVETDGWDSVNFVTVNGIISLVNLISLTFSANLTKESNLEGFAYMTSLKSLFMKLREDTECLRGEVPVWIGSLPLSLESLSLHMRPTTKYHTSAHHGYVKLNCKLERKYSTVLPLLSRLTRLSFLSLNLGGPVTANGLKQLLSLTRLRDIEFSFPLQTNKPVLLEESKEMLTVLSTFSSRSRRIQSVKLEWDQAETKTEIKTTPPHSGGTKGGDETHIDERLQHCGTLIYFIELPTILKLPVHFWKGRFGVRHLEYMHKHSCDPQCVSCKSRSD